jgi:hypothetical protein
MIISFSLTTKIAKEKGVPDPILAGVKTCTRRNWSEKQAEKWLNAYHKGDRIHQAWSNNPYVKGAYKLADIEVTAEPYQEPLNLMSEQDLFCEGNLWESKSDFMQLFESPNCLVWVLRFSLREKFL